MGAASSRRDLFLQVGGTVDPLATAMKAGRSIMREFGTDAIATTEQIEQAFQKLGGGNIEVTARSLEAAYSRTFANIRANAQSVLNAPNGVSATEIINVNGARAAAEAAELQAAALGHVADAAARAALATGAAGSAESTYAVAARAAALGAEEQAVALRSQAIALEAVQRELGVTTAGQVALRTQSGASRAGMQQLSFQIGDVAQQFSAGTPALTIFAQQSGQVIQAVGLMSTGTKGFLSILGGPWVQIGLAALVVLTPFVGKIFELGSALAAAEDKLKKDAAATDIARQAKEHFKTTVEGVNEAINAQIEALAKQELAEKSAAAQANIAAQVNLKRVISIREVTAALLQQAIAQENIDKTRAQGPGQRGETAALSLDVSSGRVAALQDQLAANEASIAKSKAALEGTIANLAVEVGERLADPIEVIRKKYHDLIEAAKQRALAEHQVTGALTAQVTALTRQRDAEIQVAQKAKRSNDRGDQQVGREINLAQARTIVESIGGRITNDWRSTARQQQLWDDKQAGRHAGPVAVPGTSDHERGQAMDIAYAPGLTLAKIKEAFRAAGVTLRQALDEPGQRIYHVAWGKKGPSAEQQQRQEDAATRRAANDDRAYQGQLDQAQRGYASSLLALNDNAEGRLQVSLQSLEAQKKQRDLEIDDLVVAKKITPARAEILQRLNASTIELREESAVRDEQSRILHEQYEIDRAELDGQIAVLQLQSELATTRKDRLRIAHDILERERQELLARQQMVIDDPNSKPKDRDAARAERGRINQQYDLKGQVTDRQNADPLQQYFDRVKANTADMNDALKSVEADGMQSLEDGLLGIIEGTESVGSAFKKMADQIIADLARIYLEKFIVSLIGSFAGGGDPSAAPGYARGGIPGYATGGGEIHGAGTGTSDSILAVYGGRRLIRVSNGEYIMNAAATRRYRPMIEAMNDNRMPGFAEGGMPDASIYYPSLPSPRSIAPSNVLQLSMPVSIHAPGADAAQLARVVEALEQLRAEVPATAVAAIAEAQSRNILRFAA